MNQATRESLAFVLQKMDEEIAKRTEKLDGMQRELLSEQGAVAELIRRRADIVADLEATQ